MNRPATVRERLRAALAATTRTLGEAGVPSPSTDARALIARAAGTDAPLVMLDALPAAFEEDLSHLVARRAAREPLQLILGLAPFRRLELRMRPGVFIPRPETEVAIDILLAHHAVNPVRRVADLCTGSGALAAAVIDELPGAEVLAVERDPAAAALAEENLARAEGQAEARPGRPPSARSRAPRGRVVRADVRDDTAFVGVHDLDAVLSNPPYVPPGAVPREVEVRDHDPAAALYGGGPDGLELPRAVIARAARLLAPGGLLIMEHADVQGPAAREAARELGVFEQVRTERDLTGRDRFLVARRSPRPSVGD